MPGVVLVAPSAWGFYLPQTGQEMGALGLVLAAAAAIGLIVARLTVATRQHKAIGLLASFAFVSALAWVGVKSAGLIMWVLALTAAIWLVAAFMTS
jgi:hypothetical protein